jgi:UPF0755 protein
MRNIKAKRRVKKYRPIIVTASGVALTAALIFGLTVKMYSDLTVWEAIQNVANPSIRYVRIVEGMRREEVADRFAKTLNWSEQEKNRFINTHTIAMRGEGFFYPDTYVVSARARAQDVSKEIADTFNEEVIEKQVKLKTGVINLDTAIKIASIIQREAGSKTDMKIVSGVIWNRLFNGMTLGMDATLQYAKGSEAKWWPQVKSEDKYIDSPYNTYKYPGLPPSAISNPGDAAIDAALNPIKTKALFYIHDSNGNIHTAETYQQHVANINAYLK